MADVKISALVSGSPASAITGAEQLEIVQGAASKGATVDQLATYIKKNVALNTQSGTTYTLVLADAGLLVRTTNAASVTITLPANSTAAFVVGDTIAIRQAGAGQITVTPAGGVTLNIPTGFAAKTGRRYATVMLHKVATDEWDITGDVGT